MEIYYRLDSRIQQKFFTSVIKNLGKISAVIISILLTACLIGIAIVPNYDPSKIVWKIDDACGILIYSNYGRFLFLS